MSLHLCLGCRTMEKCLDEIGNFASEHGLDLGGAVGLPHRFANND